MTGHTPWAQIKHKRLVSWEDFLNERKRKEDEAIKQKFFPYRHLGTGHLRHDLVKGWRDEESPRRENRLTKK